MKKVASGSAFTPKATEWNAFIDAANFVRNQELSIESNAVAQNSETGIVTIRNLSGEDQNQLSILGISGVAITPDTFELVQQFRTTPPVLDCKKLADIPECTGFVVLQEPILHNQCGRARISGITPIKLFIKEERHFFAAPMHNDTSKLESLASGPCKILWKEPGIGDKWGVVSLAGNSTQTRVQNDTGFTISEGYACETESISNGCITLTRPTKNSVLNVLAYTGVELLNGEYGTIQISEVMRFAIDSITGINAGDFIGTQEGEFRLSKNRFGFLVLATETTEQGAFAYVRYSGLPPVLKAVTDAELGSINVKHCNSDGSVEGDAFPLDVIDEVTE